MSEPFLAEICIVGFNFPPRGWAQCDGQILPINQNPSLFSLLGTTYGGDGRTSFALPDLRGRVPIHVGNGHAYGQKSGEQAVSLNESQMPSHQHTLRGTSDAATAFTPMGNVVAEVDAAFDNAYTPPGQLVGMASDAISSAGSDAGHNDMMPYLALNFVIALSGLFPSRN